MSSQRFTPMWNRIFNHFIYTPFCILRVSLLFYLLLSAGKSSVKLKQFELLLRFSYFKFYLEYEKCGDNELIF